MTEYLPPLEADEYPLWKIKYDDGDGEGLRILLVVVEVVSGR